MVDTLATTARLGRGLGGLAIAAATLTCGALLFARVPIGFVLAGTFGAPLVIAALAFAARSLYLAVRGRPPRPKPPTRPGRMEPRPLSAMAKRRPRT